MKPPPAPLIPLPVMDVPFERIAMDVMGPVPRTSSGKKYVLVICDYATRYPEVVPMKSVDAEKVAEELVKCSREWGSQEKFSQTKGKISPVSC